ncbi:DUF5389 family protein [Pasteurellaceae bacterium 22721_9_1]
MENGSLPEGFSRFSWIIAGFCSPILLWPLALLLSPAILENPNLTELQRTFMSFSMWFYPFVLGLIARMSFKIQPTQPRLAKRILIISAVIFIAVFLYIALYGF